MSGTLKIAGNSTIGTSNNNPNYKLQNMNDINFSNTLSPYRWWKPSGINNGTSWSDSVASQNFDGVSNVSTSTLSNSTSAISMTSSSYIRFDFGTSFFSYNGTFTICLLVEQFSCTPPGRIFALSATGTEDYYDQNGSFGIWYWNSTTVYVINNNNPSPPGQITLGTPPFPNIVTDSGIHALCITVNGINCGLQVDDSYTSGTFGAAGVNARYFLIGTNTNQAPTSAKIAHIMIFNTNVSQAQLGQISTYLRTGVLNPIISNNSFLQYQTSDSKWHANRLNYPTTTKTANYTMQSSDLVIYCNASSAIAITLPAFSSISAGYFYKIIDVSGTASTNNITINTSDSKTIDGASTYVINTNYGRVTIIANSTNWSII